MSYATAVFRSGRDLGGLLAAATIALTAFGCAGVQATVPLEKTYWRLVEVEGKPVLSATGARVPHVQFDPAKKRVTGYSGVNGFFGGYDLSGEALRMPRLASTRRAGPLELMELESAFLKALAATRSYRITADELELLDSSGRVLARLKAVANP